VERVADDDARDPVATGEPGDGAEIVAAIAVNLEGENGLRGEAELVGDRDADALCANIQCKKTRRLIRLRHTGLLTLRIQAAMTGAHR
jgi:hypothetical protein